MAKKVLIVEDNDKNRLLLRDILLYNGYEVIEATDGQEGIEEASRHLPDLVIMDIQMPVVDGFEARRILQESPVTKDLKVIALTAFAVNGDKERIMAAGFHGYIPKPFDTRKIAGLIDEVLRE
ncbi:MAG: response regulator [Syntrophales bacterium]|nr:response regulator [Syntrophales bacterium]